VGGIYCFRQSLCNVLDCIDAVSMASYLFDYRPQAYLNCSHSLDEDGNGDLVVLGLPSKARHRR
jgi:hypothetical protein